jgi:hypothetical protein
VEGSVSYTMTELGTWTVSAEGDYVWSRGKGHGVGSGGVMFNEMVVVAGITGQTPETAPIVSVNIPMFV